MVLKHDTITVAVMGEPAAIIKNEPGSYFA